MARLQAVVLGVAALAEGAAAAFEPERGRIEEGDADLAEQLATMSEQRLLDGLAARPAVLLLAEPGDGLVELAQREPLSAGDAACRAQTSAWRSDPETMRRCSTEA